MARRPLLTAFARLIGEMLTGEGFQTAPDGLRWWLRSDLGDFAVIDVQAARGLAGPENCFVNVAAVPGPRYDFLRWLNPANDTGEAPGTVHWAWRDRVKQPGEPWLALTDKTAVGTVGQLVLERLADPYLPLLRSFFDRDVLLTELAKKPATNQARLCRSAFLAEAGDAAGADAALGPVEHDDENLARYRSWLHEYAAAHAA